MLNIKYFILFLILCITSYVRAEDKCILSVGHGEGQAGTGGYRIAVSLQNDSPVAGLQWNLTDDLKALHIDSVLTTVRTNGFTARTYNNRVLLFDLHRQVILPGNGTIVELVVHVDTVPQDTSVIVRMDPAPLLSAINGSKIGSPQVLNGRFKIFTDMGVQSENVTVDEYQLYPNFPNPFNAGTSIQFDLKKSALVVLDVVAVTGVVVRELVHSELKQGRHRVRFNAASLPSGLYFYRLSASEYEKVRKMILIR
jgi:hypothetical protein